MKYFHFITLQALTAERFSETFFRPTKKLHHPEKNALPEEKPEDVKFVQILTEKPSVESSRSSGASRANSVVLPARVSQTTARPLTTTNVRATLLHAEWWCLEPGRRSRRLR